MHILRDFIQSPFDKKGIRNIIVSEYQISGIRLCVKLALHIDNRRKEKYYISEHLF